MPQTMNKARVRDQARVPTGGERPDGGRGRGQRAAALVDHGQPGQHVGQGHHDQRRGLRIRTGDVVRDAEPAERWARRRAWPANAKAIRAPTPATGWAGAFVLAVAGAEADQGMLMAGDGPVRLDNGVHRWTVARDLRGELVPVRMIYDDGMARGRVVRTSSEHVIDHLPASGSGWHCARRERRGGPKYGCRLWCR